MGSNPLIRQLQKLSPSARKIALTCLLGIGAGLAAVAFQLGINFIYGHGILALSRQSETVFLIGSFLIVVGTSLIVGWLLNSFCKTAAGSGIPQLKAAFWRDFGFVPWRVAWVKYVAGVLSIGGGNSLGREGPSVQLAGAAASNIAGALGVAKQDRRPAAAAGAAAGLAAAFNTPLAAITFVLEEIVGDLNSRFLGGILLASLFGAFMAHAIIGRDPSFVMPLVDTPTWMGYALTPLVAVIASVVGVYFQRSSIGLRTVCRERSTVPGWLLPLFGGLVTWVIGASVFHFTGRLGIFSLGYDDLTEALAGGLGWKLAVVLLVGKFIATSCCYGFGGCGGIFSPTLFFGGMVGIALGSLAALYCHLPQSDILTLAVVGMSATLGAVVRAPVTGILIVFEMTHEFGLVPALMIAALVSQAISRRMLKRSFYDELLHRDGIDMEQVQPPRDLKSWEELPVSAIANFKPVVASSLASSALRELLDQHPYSHFPVVENGELKGVLARSEALLALKERRAPHLEEELRASTETPIHEIQLKLVESGSGLVVLLDPGQGRVVGLVTLHDLLRRQAALIEHGDNEALV